MTESSTQSRTVSTSSTGFVGLVQELESTTLYVLSRLGPLQFAIKEDNNQKTYRVTIGSPHNCTCNCFLKAGTSTRTCIHLVFVLIKVLRIPFNHALASKTSYSDSELSVVLSGNFELTSSSNEPSRRSFKSIRASRLSTLLKSDGDQVKRQLLTEEENEDLCPICQDDMSREQVSSMTWNILFLFYFISCSFFRG